MNRKGIGIVKPIPSHKIKRVGAIGIWINQSLFFDQYFKITIRINGFQICRFPDVALTIRRMFHQLAILISITLRTAYRTKTFDNKEPVLLRVKFELVNRSPWDHEVIPVTETDFSESCFQYASAFMDKNHLIGLAILVKIIGHGMTRCRQRDVKITVDQYRFPALQVIVLRFDVEPDQAGMFQMFFPGNLWFYRIRLTEFLNNGRRVTMVNQRIQTGKSFCRDQFFCIQCTVRFTKNRVALGRYGS